MVDSRYLRASDGTGNPIIANVTAPRAVSSDTLEVSGLDNWSGFFIATSGQIGPDNFLLPSGQTVFLGHTDAGNIIIDSYAPGSSDIGNTTEDVVVIKPTSHWVDLMVDFMDAEHDHDGTHTDVTAATVSTTGDVTVGDKLNMGAEEVSTGGGIFTLPGVKVATAGTDGNIAPTINSSVYVVTALGAAGTVAAPSGGTPRDGQGLLIRIKDNGTARALTWNAIYRAVGCTLPTTTVLGKTMYIGMRYNTADGKWDCLSVSKEA